MEEHNKCKISAVGQSGWLWTLYKYEIYGARNKRCQKLLPRHILEVVTMEEHNKCEILAVGRSGWLWT